MRIRIRLWGMFSALIGGGLVAGAWFAREVATELSGYLLVVAPLLLLVGLAMIIAPGPDRPVPPYGWDFDDWLDECPLGLRITYYALAGIGLLGGVAGMVWLSFPELIAFIDAL